LEKIVAMCINKLKCKLDRHYGLIIKKIEFKTWMTRYGDTISLITT
jgi:hypothetical protein